MVRKKGTALLMVYTDVDIEHDAEFNRWYNEEHIPERLSAPGFLDGARYEALKGGPRYLAVYELESAEALQSDEYLRMSNNPTPWTQRMSPNVVGRGMVRNVYTQIYPTNPTPWAAAWPPPCKSDVWTCLPTSKPSTTSITTLYALRAICKYLAACLCAATMPLRAAPST